MVVVGHDVDDADDHDALACRLPPWPCSPAAYLPTCTLPTFVLVFMLVFLLMEMSAWMSPLMSPWMWPLT
jgi:hypothetical protein